MNKDQLLGGALRALLQGGSWMRIVHWVKAHPGRSLALHLCYENGGAIWSMQLTESGAEITGCTGHSLDEVVFEVVTKLGKLTSNG